MKIAISVWGTRGGAWANLADALTAGFVSHGVDVDVVCLEAGHSAGRFEGARVFELGGRTRTSVVALARYLRRERPEVLVALGTMQNMAAVVARGFARSSTTLVLNEGVSLSYKARVEHRGEFLGYAERLARLLYPRADGLVAASSAVLADLRATVGIGRDLPATVIPNAIRLSTIRVRATEESGLPPARRPRFVSVGRLARQKNHALLVDAFAQYAASGGCGDIVLVGDGPLRAAIEKQVDELGLHGRVTLVGFRDNPFPIMEDADAFVLSSEEEGFGLVLVECMALGVPVIATACRGGVAEVLDNGTYGCLVDDGDTDGLAAAMLRVDDDPASYLHATECARNRAETFDAPAVASQWLAFISMLVRRSSLAVTDR